VGAGSLLVRGTVEAAGTEVGVVVNGVPGAVQGTTFAVQVPVTSEITSLTAVATTATGLTASHRVAITVAGTPEGALVLHASPQSGAAPLSVSFSLIGPADVTNLALDLQGDGTVDVTGASVEGQTFTYVQPGLYAPTVTVTDAQGTGLTATALIQVYDRSTLDALLQVKWAEMKDALRAGDIAQGANHIITRSRSNYQAAFQIIAGRLQNIDSILTSLTLIKVRNAAAIYEMTRTDAGIVKSFEVRFAIDYDGIWRIEAF
jgi:hypothetical protein